MLKELRELRASLKTGGVEIARDPREEPHPPELQMIASLEDQLLDADMVASPSPRGGQPPLDAKEQAIARSGTSMAALLVFELSLGRL